MSFPVFVQSLRQVGRGLIAVGIGAAAFFYVLLLSSSTFATESPVAAFLREPPRAIQALLGGSLDFLRPAGWAATGMSHPITLSLFTASALMIASGSVATEVERGTIDLVLTRPIGRIPFLAAKAAASIVAVTYVEAMGFLSAFIARLTIDGVEQVTVAELARAFAGSWLLFTSFAMIAVLISAHSSLRGRATGLSAGIVVLSFFVNFVALLVDELYDLRFVSLFHYFNAGEVMAGATLGDLWVLVGVGVASAAISLWTFSRRDIKR